MKFLRNQKLFFLLFSFIFLSFLQTGCGPGAQKTVRKKYPQGFSLKHPRNWQAQVVDGSFIRISAKNEAEDPSFILVYPFFLKRFTQSRSWLEQNLSRFSNFFAEVDIEKMEQIRQVPDEAALKFRFQRNSIDYQGLGFCSIHERSGILYVMAARQDAFEDQKDQLISMCMSFHFLAPESASVKTPPQPKIRYSDWQDPVEQAFRLEVPQGWEIQGGTLRRASVDLVHVLHAVSPDRRIRIQFNDRNLPLFAIPNQTLAWAGFHEGSWYSPGYGVQMRVESYAPGLDFLHKYLQQNYIPGLSQFAYVNQQDRPDIVADFNRIYSQFQAFGVSFLLHAGDAAFRFAQNAEPFIGYGLALTQVVQSSSMPGGNWSVALLMIYTCPEPEAETVREIATHMFQSVRMNPHWVASQQQLAVNVSQIVTQTNQEITRIINDSYWTRQGVLDDIHRKFSNAILGMTDVVDPETGQTWKVKAGHNYYWVKSYTDQVVGTGIYERPDIDFKPLKEF
ncbi:MAG: hypothetical protein WCC06_06555 [Candidatus Aminicenantales bacterium]